MSTRRRTQIDGDGKSPVSPGAPGFRVPTSPRATSGLSAQSILRLGEGEHTDSGREGVEGLVLRVRGDARSWALRYRPKVGKVKGDQRRVTLGRVGGPLALDVAALGLGRDFTAPKALTLSAARDVARALIGLAARGLDPAQLLADATAQRKASEHEAARLAELKNGTLGELFERFVEARTPNAADLEDESRLLTKARPATINNWRQLWRVPERGVSKGGPLAPLRPVAPEALTRQQVKALHAKIAEERGAVTANRSVEALGSLYSWALDTTDEKGVPLVKASPVFKIKLHPTKSRTRILKADELAKVWAALEGEAHGDVVRLALWTGARRSEILGAEWRELDLIACTWTVPWTRSKSKKERVIALSDAAVRMLQERRAAALPGSRWVFPSRSIGRRLGSSQRLLDAVSKRSGVTGWTLHDCRRTFRSGLSSIGTPREVSEVQLGHSQGKLVETYDVYLYLVERLRAVNAWADRLALYVSGQPIAASVVPFQR